MKVTIEENKTNGLNFDKYKDQVESGITPTWKVGTRFIFKVSEDYYGQEWEIIVVRGSLQNSIDAKAKNVWFIFNEKENSITIIDDGKGMTKEVIEEKFLGIGETTKDLEDGKSIGGFGVEACGILAGSTYFHVKTNNWLLVSEDGVLYPIVKLDKEDAIKGTEIKIIRKNKIDDSKFLWFLQSNRLKQNIFLNGEKVRMFPSRGKKMENELGTVYYNQSGASIDFLLNLIFSGNTEKLKETLDKIESKNHYLEYSNHVIVRLNGLTMFTEYRYNLSGTLVLELNSNAPLTANREGFKRKYQREMDRLCDTLIIDKRSGFQDREEYHYFRSEIHNTPIRRKVGYSVTIDVDNERNQRFIQIWRQVCEIILEIGEYTNKEKYTFKYGFSFADEGASIDRENKIIYLNPHTLRLTDKNLRYTLIMRGCHEIAHIDGRSHDEDFALRFGTLMEESLKNLKRFRTEIKWR